VSYSKRVVIVGAGVSGLAAATELASRGVRVTVLEQKPSAGGRASSFRDTMTGEIVDNGQHVLIAGYKRTRFFLRRIGTEHLLRIQKTPSLLFHHPQRGFLTLDIPPLPRPLHLAAAATTSSLFRGSDRLKFMRAGVSFLTGNKPESTATISQWLKSKGQSTELIRSFWEPLAIAIMNETIERASAVSFVRSMQSAFMDSWQSSALAIPTVGLSELYVNGAESYIRARGGELRTGCDVSGLVVNASRATKVFVKDDEPVEASAVILAVPWHRLSSLLPDEMMRVSYGALSGFESSPIVSVHLWFENDFMPHDVVGIIGRTVQWIFNKRRIMSSTGKGGHVSAVISGGHEEVGMTNEELIQIALKDLRSVYPSCPETTHAIVIREKRATLSLTPAVEQFRPAQTTSIHNLFLAGDYTRTGLPCTIEGAVVSGERCARLVVTLGIEGTREMM